MYSLKGPSAHTLIDAHFYDTTPVRVLRADPCRSVCFVAAAFENDLECREIEIGFLSIQEIRIPILPIPSPVSPSIERRIYIYNYIYVNIIPWSNYTGPYTPEVVIR